MSDRQKLLNKLVEFDNSLPQIIDDYKLRYQGRIEPLMPHELADSNLPRRTSRNHFHTGYMQ